MKKRILAVLLACLMIVSLLPMSALAASVADKCADKEEHTLANTFDAIKIDDVDEGCGGWSYTIYQCPDCSEYFADKFVENSGKHQWTVKEQAVAATCTAPGKTVLKECANCGKTEGGVEVAKVPHQYVSVDGVNCQEQVCKYCGEAKTAEEDQHNWSKNPISIVEPTIENGKFVDGVAVYQCKDCGAIKTVTVKSHDCTESLKAVEGKVTTKCTVAGILAHFECTKCGAKFVQNDKGAYVPVTDADLVYYGHVLTTQHKDPTCTANGYDIEICTKCEHIVKFTLIDPKGHDYDYEKKDAKAELIENVKAPTCEKPGYHEITCGNGCGVNKQVEIPALKHDYHTVVVAATCAKPAYSYTYCANGDSCDAKESTLFQTGAGLADKDIDRGCTVTTATGKYKLVFSVGHKAGNVISVTYDAKGVLDPKNHEWKVMANADINTATCTKAGNMAYYCTNCSAYKVEEVDALGHTYLDENDKWVQDPKNCANIICQDPNCDAKDLGSIKNPYKTVEHKYGTELKTEWPKCDDNGKLSSGKAKPVAGYTYYECSVCGNKDIQGTLEYEFKEYYTNEEEAMAGHYFIEELTAVIRPNGSCTVSILTKYYCQTCQCYILVEDNETGKGHVIDKTASDYVAPVAPDCDTAGNTEGGHCKFCDTVIESKPLKELGHAWVGTAATCTDKADRKCSVCGLKDKSDALGHNYNTTKWGFTYPNIIDYASVDCLNYGYEHLGCTVCGYEIITNYTPATGHNFELNGVALKDFKAPTDLCDDETFIFNCSNGCGKYETVKVEGVGHENKDGDKFFGTCNDTEKDRYCVKCEATIGKNHVNDQTYVDPTCQHYGYWIHVCTLCGTQEVVVDEKSGYGECVGTEKITEANINALTEGKKIVTCKVCGKVTESVIYLPINGLIVKLENANGTGAGYRTGSQVKATIYLNTDAKTDVWGLIADISFNSYWDEDHAAVMEFVDYKWLSEEFPIAKVTENNLVYSYNSKGQATSGETNIRIACNTASVKGKVVDTKVVGMIALCELTFNVTGEMGEIVYADASLYEAQSTKADIAGNLQDYKRAGDDMIGSAMFVDDDGSITLADAMALYGLLTDAKAKYTKYGDVDCDGALTMADLMALYDYLTTIN